ncbi:MAG: isoprenylcysteine carboxylmethyltransferase family protein [Bacteroidales bacterium]
MALQEELEAQGNFLFKYRSKLPLLLLPVGLGIYIYQEYVKIHQPEWAIEEIYPFFCLLVAIAGLAVRVFTVGHTPKNTSGRNTGAGQIADQLNTSGIYSIVRHPLYLGNFLIWVGIAMLTENVWFITIFILAYWIYYERIMFAEEQFLRNKFGKQFLDWSSGTPAFVPAFQNYRPPSVSFSIKKVLKKEKNGFFAIFLLIFLFQYAEDIVHSGSFTVQWDFWTFAVIVTGGFYFVFKLIKKYSGLLDEAGR